MKKKFLIATLMLLSTAVLLPAAPVEVRCAVPDPAIPVGRTETAPVIDGVLEDAVWENAPECPLQLVRSKTPPSGDRRPEYPTRVRMVADDEFLYLGVEAVNPESGRGAPGAEVWDADTVEFFSDNSVNAISSNYQMLILNRFGELYLSYRGGDIPLNRLDRATVRTAVRTGDGKWCAEIAIPRNSLGLNGSTDFLLGQIGRSNPDAGEVSAAGDLNQTFHEAFRFVRFHFARSAVSFELPRELEIPVGHSELNLTAVNRGTAPLRVTAWCEFAGRTAVPEQFEFELPPGRSELKLPITLTAEDSAFTLHVADENGKILFTSLPCRFPKRALSLRLREVEAFFARAPEHPRLAELVEKFRAVRDDWAQLEAFLDAHEAELARFRLAVDSGRPELLEGNFCIYALDSMEKVASGAIIPPARRIASEIVLDGTPGGVANFQLAVVPFDRPVRNLRPVRYTFHGKIPEASLKVRREKEIDVGDGVLVPDPLSEELETNLAPEENSVIYYVSCEIPRELAMEEERECRGEIVFADDSGCRIAMPIRLRIRNFVLPESMPTLSLVNYEPFMAAGDWQRLPEEIGRELRAISCHYGLYPIRSVALPGDLDRYQVALEPEWRQLAGDSGFIFAGAMPWIEWFPPFYLKNPNRKYPTAKAYFEHLIDGYCEVARQLKEAGRLDEGYAYYDEIGIGQEEVREILTEMKRRSGLKLITCFDKPFEGSAYLDYYAGLVDFYIFNNSYFSDPALLEKIASLQAEGKKIGWYFNVSAPGAPTTFNMIDIPGAVQRFHYWKLYQFGVDATLYWGLNHFGGLDRTTEPWKASMRGNGFLVYPENGKVIPSLRLELIREGIEDLAHFRLAERLARENPDHPAAAKILELLKLEWSGPISQADVTAEQLRKFRAELDDALEILWKER